MIEYSKGSMADLKELKTLWIASFNDTLKGFKTFMKNNKNKMRIYVAKDGNRTVAMLYHIPCMFLEYKAHYLYGAATESKYRNIGIMKNLIDFSLEDAKTLGEEFSFLYPADDHLYGYYYSLGYERNCFRKQATVSRDKLMHIAEYSPFCMSLSVSGMGKLRENYLKGNSLQFSQDYMRYSVANVKNYGGYVICSGDGYCFVDEDKYKKCVVSELFAKEDDIYPLLGEMLKESDADTFVFNYSPTLNIFDNEEIVPDGMVKFLGNIKVNEAYIGLRNL